MIKLVVFDLWQTLAFRDVEYRTTERMLEATGVKISKKDVVKIFENSIQTKKWPSKQAAYGNLCKNLGLEPTDEKIKLLIQIRDEAEEQTKLYPHVIPMLTQLHAQGLKISLLSNSSVFAVEKLREKTNLLDYIDYPVFSYDVGAIKPDPRTFKAALFCAGCKPEEAIMVGDKPGDDIEPAKALGMNAILYTNYEQLKKDFAVFGILLH